MDVEKRRYILRLCGNSLFIAYLLALIYFMFFSDFYGRTQVMTEYHYNLRPFREILRFIRYRETIGSVRVMLNLAGNVLGFIPFGFFVPMHFRKTRKWNIVLLLSMEFSIVIEVLQLLLKVGSCDVDDVLLNTLGGVLGYFCYFLVQQIRRKHHG